MVQKQKQQMIGNGLKLSQSNPFGSLNIAKEFNSYDFNDLRVRLSNIKDNCRLGYKEILIEFMNYLDNEVLVKR